jgi:choline dehydrogenase-like flavoprotein
MAKQKYDYDLIVIGSGAGGSVAADIVASSGKRVAIVEGDTLGGESPNWGYYTPQTSTMTPNMVSRLAYALLLLATTIPQLRPGKTWLFSVPEQQAVQSTIRHVESDCLREWRISSAHTRSPSTDDISARPTS